MKSIPRKDKYESDAVYFVGFVKHRRRAYRYDTKDRKKAIKFFREFEKKFKSAWIIRELPIPLMVKLAYETHKKKLRDAVNGVNPLFKAFNKKRK